MNRTPKKGALLIGPLSPSGSGKHAPTPQWQFASPDRICNASSSGTYSGAKDLSYRGQGVRHPSRGVGC